MTATGEPADLVAAVRAVQATSADSFDPEEHDIAQRVTAHLEAIDRCEEALRATFSERELERLAALLASMHQDPLDDRDDGFPEDL